MPLDPDRAVSDVSDAELDAFIKQLRKQPDGLNRYIHQFLDLPREQRSQQASSVRKDIQESGPPSTHPSAGLSYLRSHSHTFNHPLYGPQENKPPVQGRVLLPQRDSRGFLRSHAVMGIGGVATEDHKHPFTRSDEEPVVAEFQPDIPGGGKVWLQIRKASVNAQGRIQLGNQRAETNALHAAGLTESLRLPEAAARSSKMTSMPRLSPFPPHKKIMHGYGLEGLGEVRTSERAVPYDEGTELKDVLQRSLRTNTTSERS